MKAGGSCRDGFGGAVSFGTLQKAVAGRPEPGASSKCQSKLLEVLSVSFETLQKAPARPRASGSCRGGFGGAIRQLRNPTKSSG